MIIPIEERDKDLVEKLKAEWPGILAWMTKGCLDWQAGGLRPAQAVREATTAYLTSEDDVATWIDQKCKRDPSAWEPTSALYQSWSMWAQSAGKSVVSMKRFSQALDTRKFKFGRSRIGGIGNPVAGYYGLRLTELAERPW